MIAVIDTSAFYAYLVAGDDFHEAVSGVLTEMARQREHMVSTSFVLCETLGLLQIRHGSGAVRTFMEKIYPAVEWLWIDEDFFKQCLHIMRARRGRGFTIVDASVAASVSQNPGAVCVAVDDDFRRMGFDVLP